MGTQIPSSPWTRYSPSTSGQAEARMWFLHSTAKFMVCIIHASLRESAGLGRVAGVPPPLSISDGAVIIQPRHWIRWSWVCYTACNSALVLAPLQVSAACAGLHQYPQCLHSIGLVAPPGLSPWCRKHGLGTCLVMVLTLIKRHPWRKKLLAGPSRRNLLNCPLPHLAN